MCAPVLSLKSTSRGSVGVGALKGNFSQKFLMFVCIQYDLMSLVFVLILAKNRHVSRMS